MRLVSCKSLMSFDSSSGKWTERLTMFHNPFERVFEANKDLIILFALPRFKSERGSRSSATVDPRSVSHLGEGGKREREGNELENQTSIGRFTIDCNFPALPLVTAFPLPLLLLFCFSSGMNSSIEGERQRGIRVGFQQREEEEGEGEGEHDLPSASST